MMMAGVAYFALVFAAGFVLGTIRVTLLAPRLGETASVLIELPVILAVSWLACGWVVDRLRVPPCIADRLLMGVLAFALLLLAEVGVSVFAFGRSVADHVARYAAPDALIGLAGQLAFAAFPVMRLIGAAHTKERP